MKRPAIAGSISLLALVGLLALAWADAEPPQELPVQEDIVPMTQDVTVAMCVDAWYESQAKAWCSTQDNQVTSNNQCYLERECGASQTSATAVTFTGTPNQVKQLHWCTNYLKVGDC